MSLFWSPRPDWPCIGQPWKRRAQLPQPGSLGHDWAWRGQLWKGIYGFHGLAPKDMAVPGEVSHGRRDASFTTWHHREWPAQGRSAMEEEAHLPWLGITGSFLTWGR